MRLISAGAALALVALLVTSTGQRAEATPPTGLDVSWPQCDKRLPSTPQAFAVVGVDYGKAYTQNPCFEQQYRWAGATGTLPSIYMTLRSPQGPTAVRGNVGPAGACSPADMHCITLNYGYNAAEAAYAHAQATVSPPPGTMWWLDIETMSHWSKDTAMNARVIQGAIDFFAQRGVMLGIYSTRSQWKEIAGDMSPGLPIWIAGAKDHVDAPTLCTPRYEFGGGPIWMVQYIANDLDHNHVCGESLAVTILTREITSASAQASTALRTPQPPPPPPAAPPVQQARQEARQEVGPPPPPPPLELAHTPGQPLQVIPPPAVTTPAKPAKDATCELPWTAATFLGLATLGADLAADRPRTETGLRRRRLPAL